MHHILKKETWSSQTQILCVGIRMRAVGKGGETKTAGKKEKKEKNEGRRRNTGDC